MSPCPRAGGNRSCGDSGQAHAQKLRPGEPYFFDGIPGGLAVRTAIMIVVLVVRVLMIVVGITVVPMMMTGIGHSVLLESSLYSTEIRNGEPCRARRTGIE